MTGEQNGRPFAAVRFGVEIRQIGGESLIAFRGELDVLAWLRLSPVVAEALRGRSRFVVDLRRVEFMDACGLRLLVPIHRQAAVHGRLPRLVPGPARVMRVLRLVGVDRLFAGADGAGHEPPARAGPEAPGRRGPRSCDPVAARLRRRAGRRTATERKGRRPAADPPGGGRWRAVCRVWLAGV